MRNCPLCGARAASPAFPYQTRWNDKDFHYVACSSCGTTFVDPVPDEADFAKMYSKEVYHDVHYGTVDTRAAAASLGKLEPFRGGRRSLLDYACGAGGFLRAAAVSGYECHGMEFASDVRDAARRNSGAKVYSPDELGASNTLFDVIHMGDILEHLPEPVKTMRELERRLAPGGMLVVEGPLQRNASPVFWSAAGFKALRRAFGADRTAGTPPTHLILTDRTAQLDFFTRTLGFRCLRYELGESGWPYFIEGEKTASPGLALKALIGLTAIALQKADPIGVLGNRFFGVFESGPRSSPPQT